eukprot:scaffold6461_cov145-Skeletonema_menzelii.AAC.10
MQPLESALRNGSPQTVTAFDEKVLDWAIAGDGRPKIPITGDLEESERSDDTDNMDEQWPQEALTFESLEEKRPILSVTWNIEQVKKEEEEEETLSMLARRKLKAMQRQERAKNIEQERKSWKTWFWSQGCPCIDWSPTYLFRGDEDQSTIAPNDQATLATFDQSSVASGTFATLGEDVDDGSTIQSFSRVESLSDTSTFEENVSDVSSNSIGGTFESVTEEELEMQAQSQLLPKPQPPSSLRCKLKLSPKKIDAKIVKDWSREGLSKNTIDDMDLYMEAMRS